MSIALTATPSPTSHGTIAAFLRGEEGMRVTTIKELASLLNLRVQLTFEEVSEEPQARESAALKAA